MHAGEHHVLRMARSHAIRQMLASVTAAHRAHKTHARLLIAQRYAERFAQILKELPAAERMAAIARLKEEQAAENKNVETAESATLAEEKQRALAPIIGQHKERSAALRRKQRHERFLLMTHMRRTPRQLRLPFGPPRFLARSFIRQQRPAPRGPAPR